MATPADLPTRRDEGAAAVEFALVAPLLFLLLFGSIQYGMLFFQIQAAASTARTAARWAAVGIPECGAYAGAVRAAAAANGVPATGRQISTRYSLLTSSSRPLAPDLVTITISFAPTPYVPFVPFPNLIERSAVARVEDTTRPSQLTCAVIT